MLPVWNLNVASPITGEKAENVVNLESDPANARVERLMVGNCC